MNSLKLVEFLKKQGVTTQQCKLDMELLEKLKGVVFAPMEENPAGRSVKPWTGYRVNWPEPFVAMAQLSA